MFYCPYKMANPELTGHYDAAQGFSTETAWNCEQGACALWCEYFGKCSLAVDAYLKGHEDFRREKGDERKDRQ